MYCPRNQKRFRAAARREKKVKDQPGTSPAAWSGWRGPKRDGHVEYLPDALPRQIKPLWTVDVSARGLGGVAATPDCVIFSDRILNDTLDEWKCVSADTGKELWTVSYPCKGTLDYGNSARATPLLDGDRVYLFGAFGHLLCVELKSGKTVWELNLRDEFDVTDEPKWGACSSPLILDGRLIVNPGGKEASLVALDPKTGKTLWKAPGKAAGYGSLITGTFGNKLQIVGHDSDSLGGWDGTTGKRLWKLVPEKPNDFNVPTPIRYGDKLLVTTENNGTRLYQFRPDGTIDLKPIAVNRKLIPDTHSPVLVGDKLYGVWRRLFCLDANDGLKTTWDAEDRAFQNYAAVVASPTRLLITTLDAELLLLDSTAKEYKELGRVKVFPDEKGLYSHPAFVGKRVYIRGSSSIIAFEW